MKKVFLAIGFLCLTSLGAVTDEEYSAAITYLSKAAGFVRYFAGEPVMEDRCSVDSVTGEQFCWQIQSKASSDAEKAAKDDFMRDFKDYQKFDFECPGSRAARIAVTKASHPDIKDMVWMYVSRDGVPGEFIHAVEAVKEYHAERREFMSA